MQTSRKTRLAQHDGNKPQHNGNKPKHNKNLHNTMETSRNTTKFAQHNGNNQNQNELYCQPHIRGICFRDRSYRSATEWQWQNKNTYNKRRIKKNK